jgi:hypothetical protein
MLFHAYLRDGIVYVPTVAKRASEPIYTNIEPVAVVSVTSTDALRQALLDTIARKNVLIPTPKDLRAAPILLKHAGVRSWSAFFHSTSQWSISEDNGTYQIVGYRKHPKRYWQQDARQRIQFPPGVTVNEVVERMVAILQHASEK